MIYLALMLSALLTLQQEDPRDLAGMTADDLAALTEKTTIAPTDTQFKKILYRTGTVDPIVFRQWAQQHNISLQQAVNDAGKYRFFPFSLEADVTSVNRFDFSKEEAKDFLSGLYFAKCETSDGFQFVLASRSSVSSWPRDGKLPEPQSIQFNAFFLGNVALDFGDQFSADEIPVFVARRFAWHPKQQSESLNVDASQVALSKAGVDISLLDVVKSRKGQPIGVREGACFWQMLSACKQSDMEVPPQRIEFADMLRKPIDSVGKATSIRGRVRQCVPVKVTDAEVAKLLGTDTWYQLTVFPDLDGTPIKVGVRDGDPEVYRNAFPVTVCVVDLPAGFSADSIVGEVFFYDGFFYRIWSYPSERTDNTKLDGQPSPLMMAVSLLKAESTVSQLQTLLTAVLFAIAIAVAVLSWYGFKTRRRKKPSQELPEQIELW